MRNLTGFTFIEILIYTFILSLTVLALGLVVLNVKQLTPTTDVVLEINHNGRFALQKIGQYIEKAKDITIETEGNTLSLSGFEEIDKNPTIFEVLDGILMLKEGDRDWLPLTTQEVRVDYLNFQKISSPYLNSIKIEMNISYYNPEGRPELDFSNFFRSSFSLKN